MKVLFKGPLRAYVFKFFLLLLVTGLVIYNSDTNGILLVAILVIQFIILIIGLMNIQDKYIRPVDVAINTVDELVKGNFRARIHQKTSGKMSDLSNQINELARNLSDLSIQEKMQSEQLSTIVNNTESGIILIDEKGYIHYVNRKFLEMFGKDSKDYNGHLYYDVLEQEEIHESVQEAYLYEKNVRVTFNWKDVLNQVQHLRVVSAPIFDERRLLKGAVVVLYDVTDLKKLDLMRKDFVANVSHELRTPITSIKGFAETLLDGAMDTPETRAEFIQIIYKESERVGLLVEDLLTLSRLEHDGFYLRESLIQIDEIIESFMPLARQKAEKRSIQFDTDIQEGISLTADGKKIKQVLINLIDNAISYTKESGVIKLTIKTVENNLLIEVKDTGIGIAPDAISRLFERFYRVDQARSRNTGGTGLGLAIVKHIVELHDGRIEIESVLGEGTTFQVYIPM